MIECSKITFCYPGRRGFSIGDVSLGVDSGEVLTLLGPNGAGKSTLLRIIAGLISPSSGSVKVCGEPVSHGGCRHIGLVLGDERTFYYRLNGRQNLEFFGGLRGMPKRSLRQRVDEVLGLVNLEDSARLQYMKYSTGMRKRLNFARALLTDPKVLLLDEPNSGVDPHSAAQIRAMIDHQRQRGTAVLISTHDMHEAERLSDRVAFLRNGSLIRNGPVREIREIVQRRVVVIEIVSSIDNRAGVELLSEDLRRCPSVESLECNGNLLRLNVTDAFDLSHAWAVIQGSGIRLAAINTVKPSLEDVFMALAG